MAKLHRGRGIIRQVGYHRAPLHFGLGEKVSLAVNQRQLMPGHVPQRADFGWVFPLHRFFQQGKKARFCFFVFPQILVQKPFQQEQIGIVRMLIAGLAASLQRLGIALSLPQQDHEVSPRIQLGWVQFNNFSQRRFHFGAILILLQ
ncbi:MAG TPA: hypothetical protein VGY77_11755 [Gemmataceae bacterium]|nr:hypothetical protein [Gemmataceae bacterium]